MRKRLGIHLGLALPRLPPNATAAALPVGEAFGHPVVLAVGPAVVQEKVVDAPHKVHKVKFQSQNHCLHVPLCAYNNAGRSEDFRKSLCVLS